MSQVGLPRTIPVLELSTTYALVVAVGVVWVGWLGLLLRVSGVGSGDGTRTSIESVVPLGFRGRR